MTTGDALFAAVRAAPEDEALRLIYADWLEEQGHPRGEFIRVQCQLAKLPAGAPERMLLEMREGELLRRHFDEFRPPRMTGVEWGGFYKGFVDRCRFASAAAFIAKGREAFDATPLRSMSIAVTGPESEVALARALEEFEPLARLTECDLGHFQSAIAHHAILASPHMTGLVRLTGPHGNWELSDRTVFEFVSGPPMPRLEELRLAHLGLTGASLTALENSSRFPALQKLDLSANPLTGAGALGRMPVSLKWLNLAGTGLGSEGCRELVAGEAMAQLEVLNLTSNHVGDDGAAALAGARCRSTLRELRLASNQIGPAGARALANVAWPALEELSLHGNSLGTAGAAALAAADMPRLRMLYLNQCEVGDAGAAALATARLPALRTLDLRQNGIGPDGARALANGAGLVEMTELMLLGNPLGREGGLALAEGQSLDKLERLSLGMSDVGSRAIKAQRALRQRFPFWSG